MKSAIAGSSSTTRTFIASMLGRLRGAAADVTRSHAWLLGHHAVDLAVAPPDADGRAPVSAGGALGRCRDGAADVAAGCLLVHRAEGGRPQLEDGVVQAARRRGRGAAWRG